MRPPLRAASVVPEEFAALHEKIRVYRKTSVAHSQSELVRPAPIAHLDQAGRIRRLGDAVISQHLPGQIARQFAGLIGVVQNTVEKWADDIRARPEARYAEAEPHVIASWPTPAFEPQPARDFSADSRRRGSVFTHLLSVEPVEE